MVFFFGDGRLGNQLFQYAFIKSLVEKQRLIISFNFDALLELMESAPNLINIRNRYVKALIRRLFVPSLHVLSKFKLISSYKVNCYLENGFILEDATFIGSKGLLPITYIYPCFAQSENFFKESIKDDFSINKKHLEKAKIFLSSTPQNHNIIFVHVRRGDYVEYEVLGKRGVALPVSYYRNTIKWYEENIENPYFVFLTDDSEFVEHYFEYVQNKIVSKNSMFVDFSIITLCEYGIMSNSSYSWWAAYLMKNRKKVFSPKYWLGWKSKLVFPSGIDPSFAEIVAVE
ncbi:alpha-1,2-fucosyltransferase [Herminiimonas aquatilis]|uniref:Alpha-1,2-fucosyltransferase n=1 Tax=Herminiimonas aquatilis TaxID=345342 RepID=A0ABW2J878_9BURK